MTHCATAVCVGIFASCSLRYSWRHSQKKESHREAVELSTFFFKIPLTASNTWFGKRAQQKQTLDVSHVIKHDTLCRCSIVILFRPCFFEVIGTGGKALTLGTLKRFNKSNGVIAWVIACTKVITHWPLNTKQNQRNEENKTETTALSKRNIREANYLYHKQSQRQFWFPDVGFLEKENLTL